MTHFKMNRRFFCRIGGWALLGCLLVFSVGCHKSSKKNAEVKTVTAKLKSVSTDLHFTGNIGPLSSQSVLSPLDGRVSEVLFNYGQQIQKDQPLISLDATKLSEDYRKAVTDFLQKKRSYEASQTSFQGTQALYKAGVISKEEYSTAARTQETDTLNYLQSKYDLEKLLKSTNISISSIETLSLTNMDQVNAILNKKFKEVKIYAPVSGVALFPAVDQKKEGSGNNRISVGDEIKAGQLILSIGDLTGFSIKFNVSEVSINLVKPNLAAKVTGDAFPGVVLDGYVASVAAQANPQGGGEGTGTFEAVVKVPHITENQSRVIRVGMSSAVSLEIPEPPQIYLPIGAVFEQNGQSMVKIVDKSGQQRSVPVVTGKTTLREVAIVQGVKPGDHVVISH